MNKNTLVILGLLVLLLGSNVHAQIDNPGFENWSIDTLYQEPDNFFSTNLQAYFATGEPNVWPVPGVSGLAARLETVSSFEDTLVGAAFNTDNLSLTGGAPYGGFSDSLIVDLRYDIPAGDTARILLVFKILGAPLTLNSIQVTGTQNTFLRHRFNLDNQLVSADSMIIAISSGDLDAPVPGGWIEVDNINIIGTGSQHPNSDFENWTALSSDEPDDWFTSNLINLFAGTPPSITKTSDANSGNFAIRIETSIGGFGVDEIDTLGFITNGGFEGEGLFPNDPISFKPNKLEGYYKNSIIGNDTSVAALVFYEFNSMTGLLDSVADFEWPFVSQPLTTYSFFDFNFDLSAIPQPDTFLVAFAASNLISETGIQVGSVLYLDDIALLFSSDIAELNISRGIMLSPNPGSEFIRFTNQRNEQLILEIRDLNGKLIYTSKFSDQLRLELGDFANGTYLYRVRSVDGNFSHSDRFIVAH